MVSNKISLFMSISFAIWINIKIMDMKIHMLIFYKKNSSKYIHVGVQGKGMK
jgi:hypothetical protein